MEKDLQYLKELSKNQLLEIQKRLSEEFCRNAGFLNDISIEMENANAPEELRDIWQKYDEYFRSFLRNSMSRLSASYGESHREFTFEFLGGKKEKNS